MTDIVNQPPHYTWIEGIECHEVADQFEFAIGSAIKYLWRHQYKGKPVEDLRKAIACIEREIKRLEKENEPT